ncbi:exosortase E/protease, VPEID-CTERM system [Poseidonocella sedimentorum]|uniref:CAAX prenyl protease 2/Lysostaphin resistance protein A-like domain-containing protein n=1 Tax=Poseidonocella sedimentorum TaxID=871652 RepID=A0A1I6ENU1_9RHOB|nr:exosortase E/protease, VPEID-CTERM system [Poseidonocella sedimentorum]SFR19251.1 hypothetical protein SAMN04515673_11614 [Poseidonocella sedimentorum]
MATDMPISDGPAPASALVLAGALLVAELALIAMVYKHGIDFTCHLNWPGVACRAANASMLSLYGLAAVLCFFALLTPAPIRALLAEAGQAGRWPLGLSLVGLAICMIPVAFLREGDGTSTLRLTFGFWVPGFALLLGGMLRYVAPPRRWRALWAGHGWTLLAIGLAGVAAPQLAIAVRPLWNLESISGLTFAAVSALVQSLGYEVGADPATRVIGAEGFFINVAPVCSGIEGLALVTLFSTIFFVLFRAELRFPHALLIYPVGLAVSMVLNVVRISALLILGIEGFPELAVGGFHSHAGWLMFTLVAIGIVITARSVPALQKFPATRSATGPTTGPTAAPALAPPPLLRDPQAARILPFAIFMLSALLAQAFSTAPGVVYPLRALAMAAALFAFRHVLPPRPATLPLPALAVGAAIGIGWVALPYPVDDPTPSYAGLTGLWLMGWMVLRAAGTILLVPVIEELFFRDYLDGKLRPRVGPVLAALVTAGLFAALHDRWIEAFAAGLALSWVMRRRGEVWDAIAAHALANAIVFAAALATGRMHII